MCVCPSSLPDGSVTVPVKALRSTCAMPGIAQLEKKDGGNNKHRRREERADVSHVASKSKFLSVIDKAGSSSHPGALDDSAVSTIQPAVLRAVINAICCNLGISQLDYRIVTLNIKVS